MRNGLKPLIVGIALFVVGAFVVPLLILVPLVLSDASEAQFLGPGRVEFSAEAPGRYYLWNEHQTIFEGTSYHRSESLPDGLNISIKDARGQRLKFTTDTSISSSSGSSAKKSIGYVEVAQPGLVSVNISGDVEPRVFSFAESQLLKVFGLIFGGVGLSILLAVVGVIVGVVGVVRLAQGSAK